MSHHTQLRRTARPRTASRLALGTAVLALALPLAACGTGTDPRNPNSSTPSESAAGTEPAEETDSATNGTDAEVDPVGRWSSPEAGEPFLDFADDGSLQGSDGCNVISTTWTVEDGTVIIEPFMSTQKACAGVDTWLSDAASATVEGTVMKIMDSKGKVIGGLEKEEK